MDFQVLQISDCVIISAEKSPAGVINLLNSFHLIALRLMREGILCRGYINFGPIYHTENQVIGSGYQNAYKGESLVTAFRKSADERGTPFIEIALEVSNYILTKKDDCVVEIFHRITTQCEGTSVLFPFKSLSHSVSLLQAFDLEKEQGSNNNIRKLIQSIKIQISKYVNDNPEAKKKTTYYIEALDKQLKNCDDMDALLSTLDKRLS